MARSLKEVEIFEHYSVPKAVAALAIPTVISQLITIVYNFADTWYVGQTNNAAAVAALSVCTPIYIIMNAVANLFGIGGSSVISRSLGVKNMDRARHTFAFALWGGIAAALLYSIVIAIFRTPLGILVGGDEDTLEYIYQYMFWTMMIGAVPTILNTLMGHLIRSVGASKQASIGMSLGVILNIVLDPIFMFVILPAGNEVMGAAIATLISNIVAMIYFFVYLFCHKEHGVFTIHPKEIRLTDGIPKEVLFIGFPAGLMTTLAMVSNIFANALVRDYGSEAVAAMGIAKKINTLAFNVTMGITQGTLPLIGYNFAAKNFRRMKEAIRFATVCAVIFSTTCFVFFWSATEPLIRFFIQDTKTVEYGVSFLKVIAFAVPFSSLTYAMNMVFQATGKKKNSFALSVLRKGFLDIPSMFVFQHFVGIMGVLYATPFADVISAVLAVAMYVWFSRKMTEE
ncbi:MAG: MATE family efflux transporter [Lachnospiraceae bacterium]